MAITLSWENKVIRYDNNQKFILLNVQHTKFLIQLNQKNILYY